MRWVALLRAVNLGARNRVPMAELRALLERTGYEEVRTYIASGNVLLEGLDDRATVAGELERLIAEAFGVATTAVLRTPAELARLVHGQPFGPDTSRSHVVFLAERPPAAAAARVATEDHGLDRAVLSESDVYLHLPHGVQGSRLSATRLERLLGIRGTQRNWRTVVKLAELAGG